MQNSAVSNQRGNALLMALALSAFVAVITVEMFRRSEVTANRSKQAQFKDETRIILEAIASNLQNPETCTRMLFNQVISPGLPAPVTLNYKYESPTFRPAETTVADGTQITNGMVIHTIEVFSVGTPDLTTQLFQEPTPMRRFRASIRTTWRSLDQPKLAMVNWRADIADNDLGLPFYVWVNDANQIKTCFGINSAGTVCNMARGYYYVAPAGQPPLAHDRTCRQTGTMISNDRPTAPPGTGACRYVGPRPTGNCPPDTFTTPGGLGYAWPMQDGSQGYRPHQYCVQCD